MGKSKKKPRVHAFRNSYYFPVLAVHNNIFIKNLLRHECKGIYFEMLRNINQEWFRKYKNLQNQVFTHEDHTFCKLLAVICELHQ